MPRGNGTGPAGMGPITGRGAGYCAGNTVADGDSGAGGREMGMGRRGAGLGMRRGPGGRHRGRRNPFFATGMSGGQCVPGGVSAIDDEQELDFLKEQAHHLEETLEGLRQRIDALQPKEAE
jgi:hypothetical protein